MKSTKTKTQEIAESDLDAKAETTNANGRKKRGHVAKTAYAQMRNRLIQGEFGPGEILREDRLVSILGVSRTVVRHVLMQLTGEGLLEDKPEQGKFVIRFTEEKLAELIPIRVALEQVAVRKAIANMKKEDEVKIKDLAAGLRNPNLDLKQQAALDDAFHRTIWQIAGNSELTRLLVRITGPFHLIGDSLFYPGRSSRGQLGLSFENFVYENERTPAGHQILAEALCARNVPSAVQAIEDHITANWGQSQPIELSQIVGKLLHKYFDSNDHREKPRKSAV